MVRSRFWKKSTVILFALLAILVMIFGWMGGWLRPPSQTQALCQNMVSVPIRQWHGAPNDDLANQLLEQTLKSTLVYYDCRPFTLRVLHYKVVDKPQLYVNADGVTYYDSTYTVLPVSSSEYGFVGTPIFVIFSIESQGDKYELSPFYSGL